MIFTKRLREGVRRGEITCSIRIWMHPHVTAGKRYRMEEGEIEVDSVLPITLASITPELARASGFKGVVDLLKVAKHGRGENVYLIRFHYVPPGGPALVDGLSPSGRRSSRVMAGTLESSPDVAGRRDRLVALCQTLPEAKAERAGAQHLAFKVRKKIFAYYVYDHHRDGRIALLCKAPPGEQSRLVDEDPDRFFVPPYVGPKGWVGIRLDSRRVDWKVVKDLLFTAYVLTAPDTLRQRSGVRRT